MRARLTGGSRRHSASNSTPEGQVTSAKNHDTQVGGIQHVGPNHDAVLIQIFFGARWIYTYWALSQADCFAMRDMLINDPAQAYALLSSRPRPVIQAAPSAPQVAIHHQTPPPSPVTQPTSFSDGWIVFFIAGAVIGLVGMASVAERRSANQVDKHKAETQVLKDQIASLRANLAEARELSRASGPVNGDIGKFRRLRAVVVKELHPDHAPNGQRAIRTEIFKRIYPQMEEIAR
jgi:hypothetical protein